MKLIIAGIISPKRDAVDAFVRRQDLDNDLVGTMRSNYADPDAAVVSVTVWDRTEVALGSLDALHGHTILFTMPERRVCTNTLHLAERDALAAARRGGGNN